MKYKLKVPNKLFQPGTIFKIDNKEFIFVEYDERNYGYAYTGGIFRDDSGSEFKGIFWGTMQAKIDVLEIASNPYYIPYD